MNKYAKADEKGNIYTTTMSKEKLKGWVKIPMDTEVERIQIIEGKVIILSNTKYKEKQLNYLKEEKKAQIEMAYSIDYESLAPPIKQSLYIMQANIADKILNNSVSKKEITAFKLNAKEYGFRDVKKYAKLIKDKHENQIEKIATITAKRKKLFNEVEKTVSIKKLDKIEWKNK